MQITSKHNLNLEHIWVVVQSPDIKFVNDHDELNLGVLCSDSISINSCKVENKDILMIDDTCLDTIIYMIILIHMDIKWIGTYY